MSRRVVPRVLGVLVATAIIVATVVIAPNTPASTQIPSEPNPVEEFHGADYFQGLYFGTGSALATLQSVGPELATGFRDIPEIADVEHEVLTHLRANDPTFFGRFESWLTSGNPLTVDLALAEASTVLYDALTAILPTNGHSIDVVKSYLRYDPISNDDTCIAVVIAAVAVAVVNWVKLWKIELWEHGANPPDALDREMLVADLTNALA